MRYSDSFIHTLYEVPKEAETPSHILLLRGSYIHPVAAGIYSLLPLGHRVAEKIKDILREELNAVLVGTAPRAVRFSGLCQTRPVR